MSIASQPKSSVFVPMLPDLSLQVGLLITSGILGAVFLLWWQAAQFPDQDFWRWLDVILISAVAGLIIGRVVHVWFVNYRYFEAYPTEIWNIWYGGLNWQSGLMVSLAVMIIAAHWRNIPLAALSDGVALTLPLLMLQGWWACREGGCGYSTVLTDDTICGWFVGYLPDRFGDVWLRYEWQVLGMLVALVIWLFLGTITLSNTFVGQRLGIALTLIGIAMLGMSLERDDWLETRLGGYGTRWLDLMVIGAGIGWVVFSRTQSTMEPEATEIGAD